MNRPIIPYNPELTKKARRLRNNSTKSEIILWKHLKGKQVHSADFHRQRPVDQFIVDFFCSELYLGIELDGYTHHLNDVARKDEIKENRLRKLGVKLIRFDDEEIYYDLDNVLSAIETVVLKRKEKFGI